MVVLVVDDQVSVVSAILSGIDWRALGVESVHKAYNAYEAKDILRTKPVDILLCDIEMPGEDGLSLYRWCGENGYALECVFLTSHADFHYAKEALRLGTFDYILQPARYEDVQATLQRVIQRVNARNEEKQYYTYGRLVVKDSALLLDAMLARWQGGGEGAQAERIAEDLAALGAPAGEDTPLYPALLEVLGWQDAGAGNDEIFRYGLHNILSEIASHYGCGVLLARRGEDTFLALLYARAGGSGLENEKAQSLYTGLLELVEKYYGCRMAAYVAPPANPGALPETLLRVEARQRDNIARSTRVFLPGEEAAARECGMPRAFAAQRWLGMLVAGDAQGVLAELDLHLNTLAEGEGAGAEELQRFYKEFMQLLFKGMEARGLTLDDVFPDSEAMQLFLGAYHSVEETRRMVYTALTALAGGEKSGGKDVVEAIIRYIQDNLEKDIRRADVAAAVHLSQDYVSHLFRKATGVSLSEFIIAEKMRVAKSLLTTTALPVSVVAARVGYTNFSYFSKTYKRVYGCSPGSERKKEGEGQITEK